MLIKELQWIGATKQRLRKFPEPARKEAGEQLWRLQTGNEPLSWRTMANLGMGVAEIRVHNPHEHRVIYVAKFPEAIYILHAFDKKTKQTAHKDIEIARTNYATMQKERKRQ